VPLKSFGTRSSPLTQSPQSAVNPANAMLNYLYTILLGEASIALNTMGLDPALGYIHLDTPHRDSLSADLAEVCRPEVDAFLFDFISKPLDRRWFFERGTGGCRLMPEICRTLSETAPMWRSAVAPFAEWIAHTLAASSPTGMPLPATRLTRRNLRQAKEHPKAPPMPAAPKVQTLCRICGAPIASKRQYCPSCAPVFQREQIIAAAKKTGWEAAHTPKAEALRGEAQKLHHAARAQWEGLPGWLTEEVYIGKIQPLLAHVTTSSIASSPGCLVGICFAYPSWQATSPRTPVG
jgi:hypothetical protein